MTAVDRQTRLTVSNIARGQRQHTLLQPLHQ